ncbi:MAG: NAD(P)-dependent oxidoreductase [Candidatus Latescibacteria bacterium]|jgi:3-hydroxyisobutyrate dehydrogenase-like beta-hydroxyacid dehydrogenase|nr:NAD(P)-dependent oxidoreductase [Candidatus Latescibacterota bacterium]MBT4141276.1 NAD(P)-dependent oxidoreductase [Candidatus Latescibacterota bacterium]
MLSVGFIGVGKMGRGMCENIIKKGYTTTVYDTDSGALVQFKDGATLASSSLEVFLDSDVIFLSLPNSDVVESIVGEFLQEDFTGKTIVDVSTSYPESTKALHAKCTAEGGQFVDAPLLGSPADTAAGTAPCMISGDREAVDHVWDIISSYASPIDNMGPIGSAHTVKIAMNFQGLMYAALAAQMFPLMEKLEIDTQKLFKVMNDGPFGNAVFDFYGRKFVEKDYRMDFALDMALKDMVYMKRLYEQFNVPAFLLDGGLSLLREAVKDGRGKHDTSEMAAVVYEYLGLDTGEGDSGVTK